MPAARSLAFGVWGVLHFRACWRRLGGGLPRGAFQAAALSNGILTNGTLINGTLSNGTLSDAGSSGGALGWELWLLAEQDLWHISVARVVDGIRPGPARRVRIPGRPLEAPPVDLALDLGGSEVVVVYESHSVVGGP